MSYASAIDQLKAMVPELYAGAGQPRRKFSLDEIRVLLAELGNPQLRFPSVLIAGTNGKGSTASTLASILSASGACTGLYTSPHLERVNERMRVDSHEIDDALFAALYFRVHDAAQRLVRSGSLPQLPSFFEILTAQALLYFAEAGVKIAILEVGMGGRLDATNVVDPILSVITDISLDHTEWLGSTLAAIACEKAGILRSNGILVALPQHLEVNQLLGELVKDLGVRKVDAVSYLPLPASDTVSTYRIKVLDAVIEVDSPLTGAHQHRNLALAIAAAAELASKFTFPITPASIAAGIRQTRWPGRLERLASSGAEWILDVAHNAAGALALRSGLTDLLRGERPRCLIFSCLRDKPLEEMAQTLFPLFELVIFVPIHTARAVPIERLVASARATGVRYNAVESVHQALECAMQAAEGKVVVVSGSVYLVGEVRSQLLASEDKS